MQTTGRPAESELVVIVVEHDGHYISLACEEYDDEPAVFLSDDPRIPSILDNWPGAEVAPWRPAHDEFDALLTGAA